MCKWAGIFVVSVMYVCKRWVLEYLRYSTGALRYDRFVYVWNNYPLIDAVANAGVGSGRRGT